MLNITLYAAKVCPVTTRIQNKIIRRVELNFMKRCLQITRKGRIGTDEIWNLMEVECSITKSVTVFSLRLLIWYWQFLHAFYKQNLGDLVFALAFITFLEYCSHSSSFFVVEIFLAFQHKVKTCRSRRCSSSRPYFHSF